MTTNFADRTIWTGDNLEILRGLNSASVDLIYLDPPFNSNRNYAAPVGSAAAGAAFKDTWTLSDLDVAWMGLVADEQPAMYQVLQAARLTHGKGMQSYLCMMAVRLLEMRRVLKDTGSIYLHCDPTASHYLKLVMDGIYGQNNFRSEITWRRNLAKGLASKGYPKNADTVLYYSFSDEFTWNRPFLPHDPAYVNKSYRHVDPETGRRYRLDNLANPNPDRPNLTYEFLGVTRVWRWTKERMEQAYRDGMVVQLQPGAVPQQKRYLDEMPGTPVDTIWDDVQPIQARSKERIGYPTQKPLALLERIIKASSAEQTTITRDGFESFASEMLVEYYGITSPSGKAIDEIKDEAASLVSSAETRSGLLVEEWPGSREVRFWHNTFREYLAAQDIRNRHARYGGLRCDVCWEEIEGYIGEGHWWQVILHLLESLNESDCTQLTERILAEDDGTPDPAGYRLPY